MQSCVQSAVWHENVLHRVQQKIDVVYFLNKTVYCNNPTIGPSQLHTKNEPNTIPSLGIYPFTVTTVREGQGLCTNGHGLRDRTVAAETNR